MELDQRTRNGIKLLKDFKAFEERTDSIINTETRRLYFHWMECFRIWASENYKLVEKYLGKDIAIKTMLPYCYIELRIGEDGSTSDMKYEKDYAKNVHKWHLNKLEKLKEDLDDILEEKENE